MTAIADLRCLSSDTRGLSIAIDYLFTVAVAIALTTLVTAVFTGAIDSTEEDATAHEVERVAGSVVAELHAADAVLTRAETGAGGVEQHRTTVEFADAFGDTAVVFSIEGGVGEQVLTARASGVTYEIQLQLDREVETEGIIDGPVIYIEADTDTGTIRLTQGGTV